MQIKVQFNNRLTKLVYNLNQNWQYNVRFFDFEGAYYGGLFLSNKVNTIMECNDLISFLKPIFYEADSIQDIEIYDNDEKVFSSQNLQFNCTYIKCSQDIQRNQVEYDLNFGEGLMLFFKFDNDYMNNQQEEG